MAKCPNCNRELAKPKKAWKYGQFTVQAYLCGNCGTDFREYFNAGKHSFTLKRAKRAGGRFVKVHFRN
jgi:transposase-like protein